MELQQRSETTVIDTLIYLFIKLFYAQYNSHTNTINCRIWSPSHLEISVPLCPRLLSFSTFSEYLGRIYADHIFSMLSHDS